MSSNPIFLDPGFLTCILLAVGLTVFFLLRKKRRPAAKQEGKPQPAPMQEPAPDAQENFVLGKKDKTCTVGKDGIRYATADGEFFAPYAEIENMGKTGGILCQFLYRGKAYDMSLDVSPAGRAETARAYEFANRLWTEARRGRPHVKRASSPDGLVYFADNGDATLAVCGDHCILTARKNAVNLLIGEKFFNGEKKLYYADLTSVQYREPDLTDGYIEFEFPGSRSGRNSSAYTGENAFQFAKLHAPLMREIRDFIDGRMRDLRQQVSRPAEAAFSPADELKKFKELLDGGVISQEEFDAKKKQLLNL